MSGARIPTQHGAEAMVFVCGVGRSGTSLLQSMLGSHPSIAFLPETAFLRRYVAPRRLERAFRSGGVAEVRRVVDGDERLQHLGIDPAALLDWGAAGGGFSDARVYRGLLRHAVRKAGVRLVGDKDPRTIEYLPCLHRVCPGAVVLHIIRDPRDVLASKKKAAWSRERSVYRHLVAGRVQLRVGRRDGRRLFGAAYRELFYEDLLADPEGELRPICAALSIPYDAGMLEFGDTARRLVRPDEVAWKRETFGPLLQDNAGKWAAELTPREVVLAETVCGRDFGQGGRYRHSDARRRLGPAARWAASLSAAALKGVAFAYESFR